MKYEQTRQSTNGRQQNELRFILVEGLLKLGIFYAVVWFLCSYLLHFGFSTANLKSSDFFDLAYRAIIGGAIFGLGSGLFRWHQNKKNSK